MLVKDLAVLIDFNKEYSINIFNRDGNEIKGHSSDTHMSKVDPDIFGFNAISKYYSVDEEILNATILSVTPCYNSIYLRVDMD